MLNRFLAHPLTRGLDIDAPETTELRARVIQKKGFLRKIYEEWYAELISSVPKISGPVLELGSGGGFLSKVLPGVFTSDVFYLPQVSMVASGIALPIKSVTLRAIIMVDVFHHLPDVQCFFKEAARTIVRGGVITMIEPWNSAWSNFIYKRLHHERMDETAEWTSSGTRPLSDANIALPWIVFKRDEARFASEFPEWKVIRLHPFMPFRYLLSGGISMRSLMPSWSFGFWRSIERLASPLAPKTGMFAKIVLERQ